MKHVAILMGGWSAEREVSLRSGKACADALERGGRYRVSRIDVDREIAATLRALKPDAALVVDVTHATDYPTVSKAQHGDIAIGGGPALTHGGCNHPEVVKRLEEVAAKKKIPLQHEAMSATSGTDTDVIFWTRGGIPSALISLPNRYMHSPVELVSLRDLDQIPALMAGFALSLDRGGQFKVKI